MLVVNVDRANCQVIRITPRRQRQFPFGQEPEMCLRVAAIKNTVCGALLRIRTCTQRGFSV